MGFLANFCKKYAGGDYDINTNATKQIYFDSPNGSLIVQDLSAGKLSIATPAPQSIPAVSAVQPKQQNNTDSTQVKKEYTESDLQKMGITGLRVEALGENIVVNQGGTSLILEYYQTNSSDYTLDTTDYEIYHGEFTTPEDIAINGGKSGMVKQLKLVSGVSLPETGRTIYVTLPADPKYSRVVKLFTDNGNIQMNQCSSTSVLDATTQSGNINVRNCDSPMLGVDTRSGNIDISNCSMKELNSKTVSGTLTLQLADHATNYKMTIDTDVEAQIAVNGKNYQGGEFILNENAHNNIYFDTKNGSLVIMEGI